MKLMVETRAPVAHPDPDQRVTLHDLSWEGYEAILAIRGENSGVRITYLDEASQTRAARAWRDALRRRSSTGGDAGSKA